MHYFETETSGHQQDVAQIKRKLHLTITLPVQFSAAS